MGHSTSKIPFNGRTHFFFDRMVMLIMQLVDERIEIDERIKFLLLALALRSRFVLFLTGFIRSQSTSLHNVTIIDFYFHHSHYNLKLMPKWEVNLAPNSQSLIVQRQLEQIVEPFGFCKDVTPPAAEAPRRRDLI